MENNQIENTSKEELAENKAEKKSTAEKIKDFKDKYFTKGNLITMLIVVAALSICLTINNVAKGLGSGIGNVVGKMVGYSEGKKDGEDQAITDPDIVVELEKAFSNLNVLEVYEIQCKISEFIAEEKDNNNSYKYAVLYTCGGKVVYKIDLDKVEITSDGNNHINVLVPYPVCEFTDDISTREKLAEYSKNSSSGDRYINVVKWMNKTSEVQKEIQKKFSEDADVLKSAKEAAVNQVKQLCENVSVTGATFSVEIKEG